MVNTALNAQWFAGTSINGLGNVSALFSTQAVNTSLAVGVACAVVSELSAGISAALKGGSQPKTMAEIARMRNFEFIKNLGADEESLLLV